MRSAADLLYRKVVLRSSEIVLVVYFAYASAVAAMLPLARPIATVAVVVNLTIIAGLHLLALAHSLRGQPLLGALRDWFPIILAPFAYRQMGWFARPTDESLERAWVAWDKMLLNDWGLRAIIECLGPLIPMALELAYPLINVIPILSVAVLVAADRRDRIDRFWFIFLIGLLLSYALFPWFPSEPPRTLYPGQDAPAIDTPFRQFNARLLGRFGIHTSVFPSAHVSAAFAAAFAMRLCLPETPMVSRGLFVLAILIALATVYGRYHYAVDALAGIAVALIARSADRLRAS